MRVSRENVRKAVENRFKDNDGNLIVTVSYVENLVARVQAIIDVTETLSTADAVMLHSIASSACHAQNYEDKKKPR